MYIKKIISVSVIIVFISCLFGCIQESPNNSDSDSDIQESDKKAISSVDNLLVLAAYKNIQENRIQNSRSLNSSIDEYRKNLSNIEIVNNESEFIWEDEFGVLHAYYPFDYIKIINAIQFTIYSEESNIEFLDEICGFGEMNVIITEFSTYKKSSPYFPDITDTAIIFLGKEGIYSCLLNGGGISNLAWDLNHEYDSYQEFSSHKKITSNAVEKDFTYPLKKFYIFQKDNTYSLEYRLIEENMDSKTLKTYHMVESSLISGSKETVYDVLTLVAMDLYHVQAKIKKINDDGTIIIEENMQTALEVLIINEKTKIYEENIQVQPDILKVGATVQITYDKLYDIHNPKTAVIKSIIILNEK